MKKREGLVNGEVIVEEGEWENNTTSPETDRTESAKLRFPNPAKFESDFRAIYQFEKAGYNQLIKSDPSRHNLERHSDQPKRRNPRHSLRSSSLDQSTISCYNELNRTFKSNCDFHFSRSGSDQWSSQLVHLKTSQPQQKTEVNNIRKNTGNLVANKNSHSTDV